MKLPRRCKSGTNRGDSKCSEQSCEDRSRAHVGPRRAYKSKNDHEGVFVAGSQYTVQSLSCGLSEKNISS